MTTHHRRVLLLLAIVTTFGLACGFLDSEVATVTYEEAIPFSFTVDANQLCPSGQACEADPVDAEEDIELAAISLSVPLDLVAATGNEDLRSISQRMRSMEITSIDYVVSENDLTFDLPEIRLYVAPPQVTESAGAGAVHLTTLPSVPAGTNTTTSAPARPEAVTPASELFKALNFNALGEGTPQVAQGQPFPPSGLAELDITVNIRIEANPLDSL